MSAINPSQSAGGGSSSPGAAVITPLAGDYLPLFGGRAGVATSVLTNNVMLIGFIPQIDLTLDRLATRCTNGTGANFRMGIYNANLSTRRPTTVRGSTTDIVSATNTNQEAAFSGGSVSLTKGTLYFIALHTSDALMQFQSVSNDEPYMQSVKPLRALAAISNATGDVGMAFNYNNQTFASGLPDLTAASPQNESQSFGVNYNPAIWGRAA